MKLGQLKKADFTQLGFTGTLVQNRKKLAIALRQQRVPIPRNLNKQGLINLVHLHKMIPARNVTGLRKQLQDIQKRQHGLLKSFESMDELKTFLSEDLYLVDVNINVLLSQESWATIQRTLAIRGIKDEEYFKDWIERNYPHLHQHEFHTPGNFAVVVVQDITIKNVRLAPDTMEHTNILMEMGGKCVLEAILRVMKKTDGYKLKKMVDLEYEFEQIGIDTKKGINTIQIREFLDEYKYRISMYGLKPDGSIAMRYIAQNPNHKRVGCLVFKINNNHCHLIEDSLIISSLSNGGKNIQKYLEPDMTQMCNYPILQKTSFTEKPTFKETGDLVYCEMTFPQLLKLADLDKRKDSININRASQSFYNPDNGVRYCAVKDYNKRKEVCDFLYQKHEIENFHFANSSYSKIGLEMCMFKNGITELKYSSYNEQVGLMIDNCTPKPIIFSEESFEGGYNYGMDGKRAYSVGMVKLDGVHLPNLTIYDNLREYNGEEITLGLYLVRDFTFAGKSFGSYCFPDHFVRKWLALGIFTKKDITHFVLARDFTNGKVLADMVRGVFEDCQVSFPEQTKHIVNSFTGLLNKKYFVSHNDFLTSSNETIAISLAEDYTVERIEGSEFSMVYGKTKKRMDKDLNVLYISVISAGIDGLIEQTLESRVQDGRLVGANTDATFWNFDIEQEEIPDSPKNESLESILLNPYKFNEDEFKPRNARKMKREPFSCLLKKWQKYRTGKRKGFFGIGGGGKSTCSIEEAQRLALETDWEIVGLSMNHSVVNLFREKGIENVRTLNAALGLDQDGNRSDAKPMNFNDKIILIDEFFTTQQKSMTALYFAIRDTDSYVTIMGDETQNGYIHKGGFKYKYTECDFLGEICDFSIKQSKLVLGRCRYTDQHTINVLEFYRKNRRFPKGTVFKKIDPLLGDNIVFTNKKRDAINKLFSKKLVVGDRFILEEHYHKEKFFKTFRGIVEKIENTTEGIKVNGIFFLKHCALGYAITSHKLQGSVVEKAYNIYEFDQMTFENQMTALGRCRSIDNIHLETKGRVAKSEYDVIPGYAPMKKGDEYELYRMYDDKHEYIGITKHEDIVRLDEHEKAKTFLVDPKIEVFGKVYGSMKYAVFYEKMYIVDCKMKYGERCINIRDVQYKEFIIPKKQVLNLCIKVQEDGRIVIRKDGQKIKEFKTGRCGVDEARKKAEEYIKSLN